MVVVHSNEAITALAERQHGLLTRRQALARGLSDGEMRGRLDSGLWKPVHRGVYGIAGSQESLEQSVLAACLAGGPGACASHRCAARVLSLPAPPAGGEPRIEITIVESRRVRGLVGVRVHLATHLDRVDRIRKDRIPLTSVARTLIDLSAVLPGPALEAVLDHALAERQVPLSYVAGRLETLGRQGRPGAGALAELIAARLPGTYRPTSDFDRLLQTALAAAGLPAVREYEVRLPSGRRAWIDFAFPDAMLAVEADSYRHHSSLRDWSRDRARNNELVALGWRVLPVTYLDLRLDPAAVTDQIAQALATRG